MTAMRSHFLLRLFVFLVIFYYVNQWVKILHENKPEIQCFGYYSQGR